MLGRFGFVYIFVDITHILCLESIKTYTEFVAINVSIKYDDAGSLPDNVHDSADPMRLFSIVIYVYYPGSSCAFTSVLVRIKKNLNAPRPSEYSPVRGENVKTFRWDHRLPIQNLFMAFKRVPLSMVVTLGQQYNVGENPTVKLYTYYINRHAGTPNKA